MPNTKNIVFHFRVRGTGAEGVHITGVANGLKSLGYTVVFVSPTNIDPTDQMLAATNQNSADTLESLMHYLADRSPQLFFEVLEIAYNALAFPRLLRNIRVHNPDFIYERYAFFNFSGVLSAKLMKKPLILEVNELSGHKRVRGQCLIWLASLVERYIFRHADLIITVSDFLRDEIINIIGAKNKVMTIPNGVPQSWLLNKPDIYEIERLREEHNLRGKKVICFIGGLVEWHNFDLLFDALHSLLADIPESILLIVGDGPMRGVLVDKVQEMTFDYNSVVFVGNVAHDKIPSYIKLADVAVIPETNKFRSPIKMFEYMAMAAPVVAPRMPAIKAVIEDGVDGLLFEPGDTRSLRASLYHILINPVYAKDIGQAAMDKIFRRYTWEHHAKEIADLIQDIIHSSIDDVN